MLNMFGPNGFCLQFPFMLLADILEPSALDAIQAWL